jgi:hypothetical protein
MLNDWFKWGTMPLTLRREVRWPDTAQTSSSRLIDLILTLYYYELFITPSKTSSGEMAEVRISTTSDI